MYADTKIAIPIFKKKKEDILRLASDYIDKGVDILELRIDAMNNPKPNEVKSIIENIGFPTIATNRIKTEGGHFNGSEDERIAILEKCGEVCEYVDVELATNRKLIDSIVETGVKTIISYHDFNKTPNIDDMLDIVKKEMKIGDIAKIAVMPQSLEDTINILAILSRCKNTIAISMGDMGSYTRVIASKFNAPITFAASDDVTAPGQIDFETMKQVMNLDLMNTEDLFADGY
ncbi:MAG: type I 3-dehydroquinate dehydratase [Methanobrevibacter sp.]|jgi:3-dehydroquinate dehydratase-1|nr:type I 3-dehydroquinate dehydratase [Candidatus Methanoflexus mossambicus]